MNKAYKFRLDPTDHQRQQLAQIAGSCRWVWNHMLATQHTRYETEKKFNFAREMANTLPQLKQQYEWLKLTPSYALQQTCRDQDFALKRVKSGFGFPKFKSKRKAKDSFRIPQNLNNGKDDLIKIKEDTVRIPKLDPIKWRKHRPIEGKVKSITISRDVDHWYASVLTEFDDVPLNPIDVATCNSIGIDLGVSHFMIDSRGNKTSSPRFLKQKALRLARYQRQYARKQRGSNNQAKARVKVAKCHQDIRRARADFLHQLSSKITTEYDLICAEDLKIKDLVKPKKQKSLNRAIHDQGWGMFIEMLKYKSAFKGKPFTQINQFAPSSKTCSCCGHKLAKLALDVREWRCPQCNTEHDRDVNAATNILFWGLAATPDIEVNTPGTGGINACGDTRTQPVLAYDNTVEVSRKQETQSTLVVG